MASCNCTITEHQLPNEQITFLKVISATDENVCVMLSKTHEHGEFPQNGSTILHDTHWL